jgi:isopenicillin-N epimerase
VRDLWTLDPDVILLNHGSFGAVPRVTQEARQRLQNAAEANPMRWFRDLPGRLVHTRERIGRYLGVGGEDLALVPNATTGVNVALRSLPAAPGRRLILTSHGYGAVLLAAVRIAAERGWTVDVVDVPLDAPDEDVVAAIGAAIDDTTAAVVVDQITSATAKVMPAEQVATVGRERGIAVIVDGAHAPALLDDPVCGDFWTGNLHKWPCAPRGTGVLYVEAGRRGEVLPPVISWWDPAGFPESFDYPGTTDAAGWLASVSALDLMESLGFAAERKRLGELVTAGAEAIALAAGGRVCDVGRPAPTMRLVELPDGLVVDDDTGSRVQAVVAAETGVELAVTNWRRHGFFRLSGHLYNGPDDFAVAAERLAPVFANRSRLEAVAAG